MTDTHVAWVIQGEDSGAATQARRVAAYTDAQVTLVSGDPLDVTGAGPAIVGAEAVHPTQHLDVALRSLDPRPDIVVFHNVNDHIREATPRIQQWAPTAVRVGMNFAEAAISAGPLAQSVPPIIRWVRQHDRLIAPSEAAANDLRAVGVESERIIEIPTLVDMSDEQTVGPDPNAPFSVGHVAVRCSPLKNQHLTVKMAHALRALDQTYSASVNITGQQNQYRQSLERTAAVLNVTDRCRFVGYVDDMVAFWANIGVNVLPSWSERHPSVVLEAARAGVPTVVADCAWADGVPECPRAKPDDAWDWANIVHELLTNDARRTRLAREQQAMVRDEFAADAVAPQYASLFADLLDEVAPFKTPAEAVV